MAEPDANYPGSYDTLTDRTAKQDKVTALRWNYIQNIIEAIQAELGLDPAGTAATLAARLAISLDLDGGIAGSSSFPGSPVADQLYTKTDEDILYRRNTANTAWLQIGGGHSRLSTTTLSAATNSGNITLEAGKHYKITFQLRNVHSSGTNQLGIRCNSRSGSEYHWTRSERDSATSPTVTNTGSNGASTYIDMGTMAGPSASVPGFMSGELFLTTTALGNLHFNVSGQYVNSGIGSSLKHVQLAGIWQEATTLTDFEIFSVDTRDITGVIYVYEYLLG